MPLYDFLCPVCGKTFESISKPFEPVICPHCGGIKCTQLPCAPMVVGTSAESKESKRREGKRERVDALYQKQGIKL